MLSVTAELYTCPKVTVKNVLYGHRLLTIRMCYLFIVLCILLKILCAFLFKLWKQIYCLFFLGHMLFKKQILITFWFKITPKQIWPISVILAYCCFVRYFIKEPAEFFVGTEAEDRTRELWLDSFLSAEGLKCNKTTTAISRHEQRVQHRKS